jgi:hypothetical protein
MTLVVAAPARILYGQPMAHDRAGSHGDWPSQGWGGKASLHAASVTAGLEQQRHATANLDDNLATILRRAQTADGQARTRLTQLQAEIAAGISALRPSMDTPAGKLQVLQFLESKATEAQHLYTTHSSAARDFASDADRLGEGYETLADDHDPTAPAQNGSQRTPNQGEPTVKMASWGNAPLSPPDTPVPPTPPGPSLPAPLRDFTEQQLQGHEVPTWTPPPPPTTGEPIKLTPALKPPTVITMDPSSESGDLFPNCDTREVLGKTGQVAGAGIGAAVAVTTGPLTAGVTWAGLGVAAITLTEAIDALAVCKGLP